MATNTGLNPSQSYIKTQQEKRAQGAFGLTPAQKETKNAIMAPVKTVDQQITENLGPVPSVTQQPVQPVQQPVQPVVQNPSVVSDGSTSFDVTEQKQVTPSVTQPVQPVQKPIEAVKTPEIQAREQQINLNLNEGYKNAPQLFADRATYEKAYNYATKPANEKAILDTYWNNVNTPKTSEEYVSAIIQGQVAPNRNVQSTPQYKEAVNRVNNMKMFAAMPTSELSAAYRSGKIDAFALSDLQKNYPDQYNGMITLSKLNGGAGQNVTSIENATTDTLINTFSELFNKQGEVGIKQQLAANPEIVRLTQQKNDYATKLTDLNAKIDSISDEVDKELEGKNASTTAAAALKASRSKSLINQAKLLEAQYNNSMTALADATKYAMYDIDRADKLQAEQRGLQQKMLMSVFDQKLAQAKTKSDFEEQLRQKSLIATDPVLATNDILDSYEKIGILPQRSRAEIIADIKTQVSQGTPLGQALSNLNKAFQEKDAYKAYMASKFPQGDKFQAVNLGDGKYVSFNTKTGQFTQSGNTDFTSLASKYPGVAAFKNNNPAGITWNANFANGTGSAKELADAGIQFEIGTARPAAEGGNYVKFASIEDGLKAQRIIMQKTYGSSTVEQMLKSWVGTKEGTKYAKQVAESAGIDLKAKIGDLSEQEINQLQIAKLRKESPGLYGELTNSGIISEGGKTLNVPTKQKQYTDSDLAILASVEKLDSAGLKVLKENNLTSEDWAKANQGMLPPSNRQVETANSIISQIEELKKHPGFSDAVGASLVKTLSTGDNFISGTNAAAFKNQYDALISNLALPNLGQLKGPMSDKDIEFIKSASSALKLSSDEEQFKKNLDELIFRYKKILDKKDLNMLEGNNQTTGGTISPATTEFLKSLGY